jgi:pteridine reductase
MNNPVALITGAAQRIGACTARRLHAAGYNIVIHYRSSNREALALAESLNQLRADSAITLACPLDDVSGLQQLATQAVQHWGRLDALINNASSFYPTPVGSASENDWNALIDSNVKGAFFLSQALAPAIAEQRGAIINIVDIHAQKPLKEHTLYCIAKAGLAMLTQSLAKELAPAIRVNGVSPGAILWPEAGGEESLSAEQKAGIVERIPLERAGEPDDIARTIEFLLAQNYITGQIIAVDGGRSLAM